MAEPIAFIDLAAQQARIRDRIDAAISRVLDHGQYIMGPEIAELETQLADFAGQRHALGCASGTDALALPLMAWGLRPGDAVFCPSFTFAATAEVVAWLGAVPVFVDILSDTYNMDPGSLRRAVEAVKSEGKLNPRVVIAVDLFGLPADYPAIRAICDEHGLKLISDTAQGFGSTTDGKHSGAWADVVATSFFPAKPLGAYGDGGATLTDDDEMIEVLRSLRVHGQGTDKYDNVRIGMNARLDTIQAAILIEKLAVFPDEIERRGRIAERYAAGLGNRFEAPVVGAGQVSTWAQYTVKLEAGTRDAFQAAMRERGVPTAAYYPRPLHRQTAYERYPVEGGTLAVTDAVAERVVSLPMHPYLDERTQDRVIEAANASAERDRAAA